MAQQNQPWRRLGLVELPQKTRQHFLDRELPVVAREIGTVAPVLAASEEEHLDTGMAARLMGGDHIGVLQPVERDILMALHVGERANAVAHHRGGLVV